MMTEIGYLGTAYFYSGYLGQFLLVLYLLLESSIFLFQGLDLLFLLLQGHNGGLKLLNLRIHKTNGYSKPTGMGSHDNMVFVKHPTAIPYSSSSNNKEGKLFPLYSIYGGWAHLVPGMIKFSFGVTDLHL